MMGLTGFESAYPRQLSGGMRKRVTLARSFAYEPETMLMDEPFAALDAQMRQSLQAELLKMVDRSTLTILFVTHDLEEAILLSDQVVVMSQRPSVIKVVRNVPMIRPRVLERDRFKPEFRALYADLWTMLRTGLPDDVTPEKRPAATAGQEAELYS